MRSTIWGNLAGAMNKRRAVVSVAKPAAQVLPALTGAAPAERHRAPGAARTLSAAGALARSILRPGAGEPDAGCESRQSSESLQPAPCAPPAPGRSRPAGRPAALARAVASARHAAVAVLVVAAALFFAAPAQAQTTDLVWSTTMTVGESSRSARGYFSGWMGSLSPDRFTIGTQEYIVTRLSMGDDTGGSTLLFSLARSLPNYAAYTLEFADETLPLADATSVTVGASNFFFTPTWLAANAPSLSAANFRTTLAVDAMPSACLRTAAQVCPGGTTTTNTAATGQPGISGTAQVGQTLTATTSGISDADGKTKAENGDTGYAYTHQWIRVDGGTETDISGETSSTYTLSSSDVGKTIRVRVSFTDDLDNPESPLPSDATAAVTAASSCSEVWCATLTVQSLNGGHRGCANSVSGKECSSTSHLTEDEFTHVGTGYAVTSVQVRSDSELRLFINPNLTTATRSLVLLVGAERFAFAHADTKAGNSRYWNGSGLNWPSGATVDLKLVEASTIATLSGLELEDGDGAAVVLTPGFSSGTTSYTAEVANSASRITLTETPDDANAWVDYLDGDGNPLTDLDTSSTGHQVDLDPGDNVIQVEVTAEDGVATRTYTVTVTWAAAGNTAPVFEDGTDVTLMVAENTAGGVDIDSPLTATDADNDSLEYTLEGADAASFDIDPDTGQLRTKTGVVYNHEAAKNSYSVMVKADDGNSGTATIAVTVNVADVDEKSVRPPMPVVTATPGTTDSLNVSWTKPGLAGGPDIVGYNVRHGVTPGSWTTVQLTGTDTMAEISGLESGTDYTVQVQARNGETPSLWSLEGTGSTGTTTTNTPATGKPTISGTAQVGQVLTAGLGNIADDDGLPATFPDDYTFQWVRVDSSNNETNVGTDSTYTPVAADVGNTISVEVSFTDGASNAETVTSDATAAVTGVTVVTVDVSIAAEHDRIGAGLEDLVFTLTRQGATTAALEATVTIVQDRSWLGTSDLSHTVTFEVGSPTATLTLAASRFSFVPDTSGNLTATVTGTGIAGGEATVEMVSTAYAPITVSYDKSSYTFAENANPADVNIYVVATLDPAYPRAPSRSFAIAMTTMSDTATFREDFVAVTWDTVRSRGLRA